MTLQEKINSNLKEAMKNKDAKTLSVLRMLNAALLNYSVSKGKRGEGLSDEEVVAIVLKEAKQRKDSISAYEEGGRDELAQSEKDELDILQKYLPEQAREEDIEKVANEIISSGVTDFGKVMGMAMGKLKGKADGALVKKVIEKILNK